MLERNTSTGTSPLHLLLGENTGPKVHGLGISPRVVGEASPKPAQNPNLPTKPDRCKAEACLVLLSEQKAARVEH